MTVVEVDEVDDELVVLVEGGDWVVTCVEDDVVVLTCVVDVVWGVELVVEDVLVVEDPVLEDELVVVVFWFLIEQEENIKSSPTLTAAYIRPWLQQVLYYRKPSSQIVIIQKVLPGQRLPKSYF